MKFRILLIIFILSYTISNGQYIEDALRYAKSNGLITQRAAALNVAYHGITDDVAALYYNPAGLTLIGSSELSMGIGFTHNSNETNYLKINNLLNSNTEYITHLAVAMPVEFDDTKAAIAIGYFLEDDYTSNMSFNVFNTHSTMINSEATLGPRSLQDNWSYLLYLSDNYGSDNDTHFVTPFKDSLSQYSLISEGGGLQNVSGGISFVVSDYVSLGLAIAGKWGDYNYSKEYSEYDDRNIYQNTSIEGHVFNRLKAQENLSQKISGINATLGVQTHIGDFFRFGVAIKTPTWYQVDETFDARYDVDYKSGQQSEFYQYNGKNTYNLRTPFVYSAGLSIHGEGLTFATGVEYTDVTQLKFSDAIPEVLALNNRIMLELVGQVTWGFGLEYSVPIAPIDLRASYSRTTSPYHIDIPNANLTNISLGAGVYLGQKVRLEGVFRWIDYSEQLTNYKVQEGLEDYANFIVNRMPLNISLGLTYRY